MNAIRLLRWFIIAGCFLLLVGVASARELRTGERCIIAADEVIDGTLFVACEELLILGRVRGHVIGAVLRGRIAGYVDESVYLLGGQMDIAGQIKGSLHFAGPVLRIHAPEVNTEQSVAIGDTLLSATFSTTIDSGVVISSGVIGMGYQLIIDGTIEGEINYWGSSFILRGLATRDVYASVGDPTTGSNQFESLLRLLSIDLELNNPGLVIGPTGTIIGVLSYEGVVPGEINGNLARPSTYTPIGVVTIPTLEEPGTFSVYIAQFIREATTLLALGWLLLIFTPSSLRVPLEVIRYRPVNSFSVGMLAFILSFPIVLILIVLSVIVLILLLLMRLDGVAVAASIFFGLINFGGVTLFYFIAIFLTRMLVAYGIGRFIFLIAFGDHATGRNQYFAMFMGVAVLSLAASLPYVGVVINGLALFLGLGSILVINLDRFGAMRDMNIPTSRPSWYPLTEASARFSRSPGMSSIYMPYADPTPSHAGSSSSDDESVTSGSASLPPITPRHGIDNLPDGFDLSFFEEDEP